MTRARITLHVADRGNTDAEGGRQLAGVARRNGLLVTLDGAGWHVGLSCLSWGAILPAWVAHLGGGPLASAAVVCLWVAGVRLPQALSAWWAEGLRRTRAFLLLLAIGQRIAVLGIVVAAAFASEGSRLSLALFFICYCAWCLSSGLAFPVWIELLSRALHPGSIGRVLGLRNTVANILGVASTLWIATLLGRLPFPHNYCAVFLLGLVALVLGFIPLTMLHEFPRPSAPKREPFTDYLRSCIRLPREDPRLLRLIIGMALVSCLYMPSGLYLPYAMSHYGAGLDMAARDGSAGFFTVVQTLALALAAWPAGRAVDRLGSRTMVMVGGMLAAATAAAPLLAWGLRSYAVVFALQGVTLATFNLAVARLYVELAAGASRSRAVVMTEVMVAPVVLLSTLGGGFAVSRIGYAPIFILSAALTLLGARVLASDRPGAGHPSNPATRSAVAGPEQAP